MEGRKGNDPFPQDSQSWMLPLHHRPIKDSGILFPCANNTISLHLLAQRISALPFELIVWLSCVTTSMFTDFSEIIEKESPLPRITEVRYL